MSAGADRGEPAATIYPVSRPSRIPSVLVGLASALLVAQQYRASERRSLNEVSQAALARVDSEIEGRLQEQIQALERIAGRWELRGGIRQTEWEFDARQLLDHFPHMQAIEWVDASFRVRWILPLEGNEAAVGIDLSFEERRLRALEAARDRGVVSVTRPVELVQGGRGFLVYVPLYPDDRFDGFILGVYRTEPLLDQFLRNIVPGFDVRIWDAGEELWARSVGPTLPTGGPVGKLAFYDTVWDVEIAPGPAVVAAHLTWLPWLVLVGGAVAAFFFGLSMHLARSGRWRAAQQLAANAQLLEEMERRKSADEELARHRHQLEELVEARTAARERTHEELRRSERLASIGTFATGIAHQINNPLGGILLAARSAQDSKDDRAGVEIALADIVADAKRCGGIVRSLLRFAREDVFDKAPADLNAIVRSAAERLPDRGAGVELQLADALPPLSLNEVAIGEVIVNLLQNAVDAGAERIVLQTRATRDFARLTLCDDGRGIDTEDLHPVFDPFFTQRPGKGTGLGLSIAHGLVAEHGGTIDLASEPGSGTTVTVNLPIHAGSNGEDPHR